AIIAEIGLIAGENSCAYLYDLFPDNPLKAGESIENQSSLTSLCRASQAPDFCA
ncbi:MAG: hypothetical protein ACI9MB_002122, partial [Verrucomicrobiales bacterium]